MSIKENLNEYLKNLNYQIQVESMGLNSWGGEKKRQPNKIFELPSTDKLLNVKKEMENKQLAKQQQIQLYLEKEKQPVVIDGQEYKYNQITEPNFDDVEDVKNDLEQNKGFLKNLEGEKKALERLYIRRLNQKNTFNKNIDDIKKDILDLDDRIIILEKPETKAKSKSNKINKIKEKQFKMGVNIKDIENAIEKVNEIIKDLETDINNKTVEIENEKDAITNNINTINETEKENKKKLEDYAQELRRVNFGSFNIDKLYGETDEQYFDRLSKNAQIPFDNSTTQLLSDIERNNIFKENLRLLFDDEAFIEQILNYLKSTNDHYIFIFNQNFNLFKDDYLKIYGYNNKTISFNKFIDMIDTFCEASPMGEPSLITPSQIIKIKQNLFLPNQSQNLMLGQDIPKEESKVEIIDVEPENLDIYKTITDKKTLRFNDERTVLRISEKENPNESMYIRYIEGEFKEGKTPKGDIIKFQNPNKAVEKIIRGPILLISYNGEIDSYVELSYGTNKKPNIYKSFLIDGLGLTNEQVKKIFNIKNIQSLEPEKIKIILDILKLNPSPVDKNIPKMINKKEMDPKFGYGINNDIPEYIQFGKHILLLKKLLLKNILSIQKKNRQKVPGFKNFKVSDNFVNLIEKMYKDQSNIKIQDVSILSPKERELFDNLLSLCELNKKIITGSGMDTIKKVKEELKLIEGQIEAGNNNPILKQELYNVLFKLVNFGSITERQARTHYKNVCKDFFN